MRPRTGNSFATLLMTLPLLAIPLMAVFGVPQFVPVVASSTTENELDRPKLKKPSGVGESLAPSFISQTAAAENPRSQQDRLDDLFRPASRVRPTAETSRRVRAVPETALASHSTRTVATRADSQHEHQRLIDLFGEEPTSSTEKSLEKRTVPSRVASSSVKPTPFVAANDTASNELEPEGLTWQQAVSRLNELGIHDFRLEPGHNPGDFYFACEFSPNGGARISRRFEAEAREPLEAVELVLHQIDEWMPRR